MEKEVAEKIVVASEAYVRTLTEALRNAMEQCEPDAVERFRRSVGLVIGRMETDLFTPLYARFPDLEPEHHRKGRDET